MSDVPTTSSSDCKPTRKRAGSTITRELMKQGIGWHLASLMECTKKRMRELERHLKDQKNAKRYCADCTKPPQSMPGTTHYPVEEIPFPTTSRELRRTTTPETVQTVRFTADNEPRWIMDQVKRLWKVDKDALGFIPIGGTGGLEGLAKRGYVAIVAAGHDVYGFAAFNFNPQRTRITIHQCCVADAHRLQGYGKQLIDMIAKTHQPETIEAKVRDDLAANHFWAAIGFVHVEHKHHKSSKRKINTYRLTLRKGMQ